MLVHLAPMNINKKMCNAIPWVNKTNKTVTLFLAGIARFPNTVAGT